MVDVTFPFIILLAGVLVGVVTARVRRHTGWRKAADILVAAICGPAATTFWIRLLPRLFPSSPLSEPRLGILSGRRALVLAGDRRLCRCHRRRHRLPPGRA